MSIVRLPNVAQGVNADSMPEELADGQWSTLTNMLVRDGHLERAKGMRALFATPTTTPYFVTPFRTAGSLYWVHIGLSMAFVDDGTTRTEIGRSTAYTGNPADRWNATTFSGFLVFTNGVDAPQSWNGSPASRAVDLVNWPSAFKCRAIKAFKNVLVALDITNGSGVRFPFRMRWSAIADTGALPPSWDVADPTREAGELDIQNAGGPLIDAEVLGDQLIVYTTASAHAVRFVGGQNFFTVTKLPGNYGLLARGCVVDTPVGHVALTNGDVIVHQGGEPRSIAKGRVQRALFSAMDNNSAVARAFLVHHASEKEVWVCFPEDGSATCSKAYVWNYSEDTWSPRTLRNVTHGAAGQTPSPPFPTYATTTDTYATTTLTYGGKLASPNDTRLVFAHAIPAITVADQGAQDAGVSIAAIAERTGLHFGDPEGLKLVRRVWPRIDGDPGTVVTVQMGWSQTPDVAPTWGTAASFTLGTSQKVDLFAKGRYLALRLLSTSDANWRLRGLDFDIVPSGRF